MANQTNQLRRFLSEEGADVRVVRTNAPYRPALVGHLRGVRAFFRLVPYRARLRESARGASLFHVMANSGWAWYFFAAPALAAAHRGGVPAVLNYRGGDAERFFARSFRSVEKWLKTAATVVVPSDFLKDARALRRGPRSCQISPISATDQDREGNGGPRLLIAATWSHSCATDPSRF
jgi:hypothetical protein